MWSKIFFVIFALFMIWWLWRYYQANPQAFSKVNFSKSFFVMGILSLILIVFVTLWVLWLRAGWYRSFGVAAHLNERNSVILILSSDWRLARDFIISPRVAAHLNERNSVILILSSDWRLARDFIISPRVAAHPWAIICNPFRVKLPRLILYYSYSIWYLAAWHKFFTKFMSVWPFLFIFMVLGLNKRILS